CCLLSSYFITCSSFHFLLCTTLPPPISTLSLHDALPIYVHDDSKIDEGQLKASGAHGVVKPGKNNVQVVEGTEVEHEAEEMKRKIGRATSELQSRFDLVCRLLLEKKKSITSNVQ